MSANSNVDIIGRVAAKREPRLVFVSSIRSQKSALVLHGPPMRIDNPGLKCSNVFARFSSFPKITSAWLNNCKVSVPEPNPGTAFVHPATTQAVLIVLVAALMNAAYALPMKLNRKWHWEHSWFAFSILGEALVPTLIAWATVPRLWSTYSSVPPGRCC